ncbi:MAG: hypothetical protein WC598_15335 [Methanoregula sp.]
MRTPRLRIATAAFQTNVPASPKQFQHGTSGMHGEPVDLVEAKDATLNLTTLDREDA